jgi:nitrogen fixation-related uncharacterized protein
LLKIFEVLVLLGAGILFFWWQFDDLRRARESSRKKKQLESNAQKDLDGG